MADATKNPTHAYSYLFGRVFGLTDLDAVREGRIGRECRGEEHEVELVGCKKSGRTKIYWNQCNITKLFHPREGRNNGKIDYSWKTCSGETLHIASSGDGKIASASAQYDLLIDGRNFFTLPSVGGLGRTSDEVTEQRSPKEDAGSQRSPSLNSSTSANEQEEAELPIDACRSQSFRLSLAGLNSTASSDDGIKDELHSDIYSPVFESLRAQIVERLPQCEEMVSRSIINAFFFDSFSQESFSLCSVEEADPYQVEADCVSEAYAWIKLNGDLIPPSDAEDLAMWFLRKRVDDIFIRMRNEELSSDDAARVVLSMAAVLGLTFASSFVQDTIIMNGLDGGTTACDLHETFSSFGKVKATAMARATPSFGFCRFEHEDSTARAAISFFDGTLIVGSASPEIMVLSGNTASLCRVCSQDAEEHRQLDESAEGSAFISAVPVNTPHLMGPLRSDDCAHLFVSPDCVTQLWSLSPEIHLAIDADQRFCPEQLPFLSY